MHVLLSLLILAGPQDDLAQKVRALVVKLGSDEPDARAAAERDLLALGPKAREALSAHADHADADVRSRVRAILADVAMHEMDDAIREPLRAFGSAAPADLGAAVEALLKFDRTKLKVGLKTAAASSHGALKFRARQLQEIIASDPSDGLIYGIILPDEILAVGGAIAPTQVWINETDAACSYWNTSGSVIVESSPPPKEGAPEVRGATFVLEEPHGLMFTVAARGARTSVVDEPIDILEGASPGKYVIHARYRSDDQYVERKPANFWNGKTVSNKVEFTVK